MKAGQEKFVKKGTGIAIVITRDMFSASKIFLETKNVPA